MYASARTAFADHCVGAGTAGTSASLEEGTVDDFGFQLLGLNRDSDAI
jgi:hypothetical protein